MPAALAVAAMFSIMPALIRADALDDVRRRGVLVWGADQEGGGPFVYPDPADPDRVIGFEVELAELLAQALGVHARFFQADWTTLPEFLENDTIHVVLNGYESTPGRNARMLSTRPYYIYQLQLLAREDDQRIERFEDLCNPPRGGRYSVGVLGGSAAATFLGDSCGSAVAAYEYDGNTNAMAQVRSGVHDATLQDLPIAVFYHRKPQGRGLKFVGPPVGRGYYVMYVRKGETRLAEAINAALRSAISDGRLRAIYERYELWNNAQEALASASAESAGAQEATGLAAVRRYGPVLVRSAGMTVLLSLASMPLAMAIGLAVELARRYGPKILGRMLTLYVEVIRGTPVMLQLYVIYFLMPKVVGVGLNPIIAAIAGLAINYSAYEAEVYRAGLSAIPTGQMEAALALGMSKAIALRRIIIPQAVRLVIPPVTNDFISLFKDTSICSVIAVVELTKQYNMLANNTSAVLEVAAMTGLLYLAMSYPLSVVARRAEARLAGLPSRVTA